ncbi:MAG: ferric reductase-like transmembrane domain-containing protein [Bryobacteraceae bacterium]
MKLMVKGILWFGLYLLLILFPLIVGWLRHSPGVEGRSFSLQFSAACGYVAFSVMAFEFALIARVEFVSAAVGQDSLLKFHRQMGIVAALLLALHVIFVFRNGYPFEWLYPIYDGIVQWGTLAMYAVVLLIILSLGRRRFGISYSTWQVRYPPRSGWLDELDRLKGGWPLV